MTRRANSRRPLREGMRAGDLNDLVLPLISVDEYDSTINQDAVAIGFYVHDESAAKDLDRFLQRSPVAILSSEVSPAPDQHGYFIVFIELLPDDRIAINLQSLLQEIEPLCEIGTWKMRVRKTDGLLPFTVENFNKALAHARHADAQLKKQHSVLEFLTPSLLENASFIQDDLILEASNGLFQQYKLVDYGTLGEILQRNQLAHHALGLSWTHFARTSRVEKMLGEGWSVSEIGRYTLLQHSATKNCVLLV